jgi:hypothetical protein
MRIWAEAPKVCLVPLHSTTTLFSGFGFQMRETIRQFANDRREKLPKNIPGHWVVWTWPSCGQAYWHAWKSSLVVNGMSESGFAVMQLAFRAQSSCWLQPRNRN